MLLEIGSFRHPTHRRDADWIILITIFNNQLKILTKKDYNDHYALTLYGPNSFFHRFSGHNLR